MNTTQAAAATANKGAQLASKHAPKSLKRGLGSVENLGERGINKVVNSRAGQYFGNKATELINKTRTGATKLMFNAGLIKKDENGITTIGDLTNADTITQLMVLIIVLLFLIIFFWCFNKIGLNKKNCTTIDKLYDKFPLISSIDETNPKYKFKLRDYYIKTAYNCCAGGNFKNDFVNLCALRNCIKQGARCLDFEIYSVNNIPVIAVSSVADYNVKESYNNIPFDKAMEAVSNYAFSGGNCPNPDDPIILHFRIMTNSIDIHNEMAKELYNTLGDKLLGKQFSYENTGKNIGSYPISKLMGSVIIMIDKSNPLFTTSLLNEYVNITSNSAFVRLLRFNDVIYSPDKDELIDYNKQNMTISLPNLSAQNSNYSSALAMTFGCQMIGMSFQNFDNYLQYYTQFFDDAGSAFVLRPDRYRYIPMYVPEPRAQDPEVTFANKIFSVNADLPPLNV
jgi:hypothetical protein